MSYRLIDSNAIAIKYPEVNEMPCVFANLPDGMNGQFIDVQPEVLACGNGELIAQPEPQWIPVSERLPEEPGYYITSNEYNGVGEDFYYDGHFCNADKNAYEVLAWMPKPEHYKPNK